MVTNKNIITEKEAIHIRGKLKDRRTALGLKQKEVAERAGIHKAYYSKIEAGLRTPALEVWLKIGTILEIPEAQLISYIKDGMKRGA